MQELVGGLAAYRQSCMLTRDGECASPYSPANYGAFLAGADPAQTYTK